MITVNGTDLSTLGFTAARRTLPRTPRLRPVLAEVPGSMPLYLGFAGVDSTLVVEGVIAQPTHAALNAALDNLSALLAGECVVRLSDLDDREWVGSLDPSSDVASLTRAAWISLAAAVRLVFRVPSTARARIETSVGGLNPTLLLGTATSPLSIDVQNGVSTAITQITVAVRAGSTVLRTLQWTGSVPSGALWRLVMDPAWEITVAGVNAVHGLSAASVWSLADPREGATNVLVTVTGGSPTVTTRYRRRWW